MSASTMQPVALLSPLNFRGLIDSQRAGLSPTPDAAEGKNSRPRRAIECWKCPECYEVHEWEEDAVDCCAPDSVNADDLSRSAHCPVCRHDAGVWEFREAADCCLWKDLDAPTRWKIADAVEAGATWAEALGMDTSKAVPV